MVLSQYQNICSAWNSINASVAASERLVGFEVVVGGLRLEEGVHIICRPESKLEQGSKYFKDALGRRGGVFFNCWEFQ